MKTLLPILPLVLLLHSAQAIINFGGDNNHNTTDPGTGVPWDAVARVANYDGTSFDSPNFSGTAIHLGNGYMLTADHVANLSHVTFDGVTPIARDNSFTPTQVTPNVDLKIFKLASTPNTSSVNLLSSLIEDFTAEATLVAYGRGRNPSSPINSDTVDWGNNSTIDKRWGLNVPEAAASVSQSSYNYEALFTVLGNNTPLGANEAGTVFFDSGSGLFQEISGTWYLIGVATTTSQSGESVFGEDTFSPNPAEGQGDWNAFVRVSEYESEIVALIPEPGGFAFLFGAVTVGACMLVRSRAKTAV